MHNIHEHQVAFMENFEKQGGVSFFLLSFTKRDEFYYLRLDMLLEFWKRAKEGGRKSFRYEELDPEYFLPRQRGVLGSVSGCTAEGFGCAGIDNYSKISYNKQSFTCYHATIVAR